METEQQIQARKQRGLQIAQTSRIVRTEQGYWKVPSQSGAGFYIVKSKGDGAKCNCPDCKEWGHKCKHIWAIELIVTQEVDSEGNVTLNIQHGGSGWSTGAELPPEPTNQALRPPPPTAPPPRSYPGVEPEDFGPGGKYPPPDLIPPRGP